MFLPILTDGNCDGAARFKVVWTFLIRNKAVKYDVFLSHYK
jgi:hypothetical protein